LLARLRPADHPPGRNRCHHPLPVDPDRPPGRDHAARRRHPRLPLQRLRQGRRPPLSV